MQPAKQYCDEQNAADKLYFTSDTLAFFEERNAINHAKGLADKTIVTRTKADVEAEAEALFNDSWEGEPEYGLPDDFYIV